MMIKELIVVEGKDDVSAIKAAVDAEVISTHGYGYGRKFIETLKKISRRRGVIIFTDPDYMGKKIRRDLSNCIPDVKHAFLSQGKALKDKDIGVENASPEDIREALMNARCEQFSPKQTFSGDDLIKNRLSGGKNSSARRLKLCEILGIGHSNSKQLLNKLNFFGISREEFECAVRRLDDIE